MERVSGAGADDRDVDGDGRHVVETNEVKGGADDKDVDGNG